MRAAVIREYGGRDKIRVEEVPTPAPGPGEVLLRVRACALNRLDVFGRQGLRGPAVHTPQLPHVSGVDAAGEVAALGPGVTGFAPGDPVVVYSGLFCGRCEYCLAGEQSMCDHYRIWGEHTWGGLAEYAVVPAQNLLPIPRGFPFEKAAAAPVAHTTAWRMLMTAGRLRAGETVLVLGASGGVGVAAVQIGVRAGARVIACASGAAKLARLREIGAHETIDYAADTDPAADRIVTAVRELTGGRGVDLVADPLGAPTWRQSINSLRKGGRMVICGATGGDQPAISIRELYQRHRRILGAPMGNLSDFRQVLSLVLRGEIEPVIHAVLPLERIAEGHRLIEEREHVGKVVMVP